MSLILWVFIGIGFIGSLALTLAAVFNIRKAIKTKSYGHIHVSTQVMFAIANLMFFIYALGISIISYDQGHFWNSAPTWIGNFIPLILNVILIAGRIKMNRQIKAKVQ